MDHLYLCMQSSKGSRFLAVVCDRRYITTVGVSHNLNIYRSPYDFAKLHKIVSINNNQTTYSVQASLKLVIEWLVSLKLMEDCNLKRMCKLSYFDFFMKIFYQHFIPAVLEGLLEGIRSRPDFKYVILKFPISWFHLTHNEFPF